MESTSQCNSLIGCSLKWLCCSLSDQNLPLTKSGFDHTSVIESPLRARICKLLRSPGIDSKDRRATYAGGIDSLESIPGLLKSFKIRALAVTVYCTPQSSSRGSKMGRTNTTYSLHFYEILLDRHVLFSDF
jgi:hypothetical protein